jgi:hypothetical protein
MRIKHNLWKVSNGWLMVPDTVDGMLPVDDAPRCVVFTSLKEFADWKPRRVRRKKATMKSAKPGQTESEQ